MVTQNLICLSDCIHKKRLESLISVRCKCVGFTRTAGRCVAAWGADRNNGAPNLSYYPHITICMFAHLHKGLGEKNTCRWVDRCGESVKFICVIREDQRGRLNLEGTLQKEELWPPSKGKQHLAPQRLVLMTNKLLGSTWKRGILGSPSMTFSNTLPPHTIEHTIHLLRGATVLPRPIHRPSL